MPNAKILRADARPTQPLRVFSGNEAGSASTAIATIVAPEVHVEPNSKPIAQYMSAAPVSVQLDAELASAVHLMERHGIRHLPVLDATKLVGIVSERDLAVVESLVPNDWERFPVAEAMTTDPYVVAPATPLREVARVMVDQQYGCVLVAEASGKLVGLFSTIDALRILAGNV